MAAARRRNGGCSGASLRVCATVALLYSALIGARIAQAEGASVDFCKSVGKGYFLLPGTSTCVAFTADLKTDYRVRSSRAEIFVEPQRDETGPNVIHAVRPLPADRPVARQLTEVKAFYHVVTPTEYGPLKSSIGFKYQLETPPRRPRDSTNEFNRTGERMLLERASIQLGGFSVGVMPSFFDFTPSLSYTTLYASEQSVPLIAYTHRVNSTDFTLSLEDGRLRRVTDPSWGEYRSEPAPDVVGAVRRRFDWGTVQFAAAAHPVHAVQPLDCCARATGDALGWAVMAGTEAWIDVAGMAGELLLNVGASNGALSYLGASNYPADFALSRTGKVFLTEAQAAVAAYAHWWTKQWRTVFTFSGFRTNLETDTFRLRTEGLRLQGALEFYPAVVSGRRLLTGLELNYHDERVTGAEGAVSRAGLSNNYVSAVIYARRRF